jgi:hypothetical protein
MSGASSKSSFQLEPGYFTPHATESMIDAPWTCHSFFLHAPQRERRRVRAVSPCFRGGLAFPHNSSSLISAQHHQQLSPCSSVASQVNQQIQHGLLRSNFGCGYGPFGQQERCVHQDHGRAGEAELPVGMHLVGGSLLCCSRWLCLFVRSDEEALSESERQCVCLLHAVAHSPSRFSASRHHSP